MLPVSLTKEAWQAVLSALYFAENNDPCSHPYLVEITNGIEEELSMHSSWNAEDETDDG